MLELMYRAWATFATMRHNLKSKRRVLWPLSKPVDPYHNTRHLSRHFVEEFLTSFARVDGLVLFNITLVTYWSLKGPAARSKVGEGRRRRRRRRSLFATSRPRLLVACSTTLNLSQMKTHSNLKLPFKEGRPP